MEKLMEHRRNINENQRMQCLALKNLNSNSKLEDREYKAQEAMLSRFYFSQIFFKKGQNVNVNLSLYRVPKEIFYPVHLLLQADCQVQIILPSHSAIWVRMFPPFCFNETINCFHLLLLLVSLLLPL